MKLTSALRHWYLFSILLLALVFSVNAQNALVLKNTNLRKDPSSKHQPIELLQVDDELQILDQTTDPYYFKVRAEDRKTGWVWRKAVEIIPDPNGNVPPSPPSPSPNPDPNPNAGSISPEWPKPDPVDSDFQGSEGTCGPTGDGGDTLTNARKNRIDPLPDVHDVAWNAIASLSFPPAPASRANWTAAQLNQIKPYYAV